LGGVAFITLLERKLLGLRQVRLGPNKNTFFGVLQPVADGIKLLLKENLFVIMRKSFLYVCSPFLLLGFFLLVWTWLIPWLGGLNSFKYGALFYFSLLGLGAYAVIITGWRSIRGFSKLGRLRGILQSLSFEVALILRFIIVLRRFKRFALKRDEGLAIELFFIWVILWIGLSLMETNRAPFDLLEGERELIRGFNIEIGRLSFVYLFLREYGIILVMALISRIIVLGEVNEITFGFFSLLLFMRSCFPRVRYDVIISFMWQSVLPIVIVMFLILFLGF
jgi:NADH-ubiquinone oxidoreductase chain 1